MIRPLIWLGKLRRDIEAVTDKTKKRRLAVVNADSCVACGTCFAVCPFEAMEIYKGCYARPVGERCVGCGTCERNCPIGCISIKIREEAV